MLLFSKSNPKHPQYSRCDAENMFLIPNGQLSWVIFLRVGPSECSLADMQPSNRWNISEIFGNSAQHSLSPGMWVSVPVIWSRTTKTKHLMSSHVLHSAFGKANNTESIIPVVDCIRIPKWKMHSLSAYSVNALGLSQGYTFQDRLWPWQWQRLLRKVNWNALTYSRALFTTCILCRSARATSKHFG